MLGDRQGIGAEVEVRAAYQDLVAASGVGDARAADRAMTRLAGFLGGHADVSTREMSVLALAECLLARRELDEGRGGAARLSAATALVMARNLDGDDMARPLGRVLISTAQLACDLGDVEVARGRAREALAIVQAALGPVDPDTAEAWEVLGEACQAAGDPVGANAARRQARAARQRRDRGEEDRQFAPDADWL